MADSQKMLKMRPQAINSKLFDPNCNILEICLKQAALFDDFYQFYCGSDLGDCVVMKEEEGREGNRITPGGCFNASILTGHN